MYTSHPNLRIYIQRFSIYQHMTTLEARLDLLFNILQCPIAPGLLAPDSIGLCLGEALGLNGRIVSKAGELSDLRAADRLSDLAVGSFVDRADDGTTETKVVLQARRGARHQSVVGPATEVPDELRALGDAGGAEWVALGDEAAGRVDDHLAAVGDVAVADHLVGLAWRAQAESVDGDHLVGGEAVVQFADLDLVGSDAGLLHGFLGRVCAHAVADELDAALVECGWRVSGQALARDEYCLALKMRTSVKEGLGNENGGG